MVLIVRLVGKETVDVHEIENDEMYFLLLLFISSLCFLYKCCCFCSVRKQTECSKSELVGFSSQLSWRSSCVLSSEASWLHQRLMSVFRDDTDRSGWSHDSSCTTRLLWRTQHSYCPRCHCPDLLLKRQNHDKEKENHQQFLKKKK